MQFIVSYMYCGKEATESFPDKFGALTFIEDNINKEDHECFKLYERVPITINVM
jgi:hypothetical protein